MKNSQVIKVPPPPLHRRHKMRHFTSLKKHIYLCASCLFFPFRTTNVANGEGCCMFYIYSTSQESSSRIALPRRTMFNTLCPASFPFEKPHSSPQEKSRIYKGILWPANECCQWSTNECPWKQKAKQRRGACEGDTLIMVGIPLSSRPWVGKWSWEQYTILSLRSKQRPPAECGYTLAKLKLSNVASLTHKKRRSILAYGWNILVFHSSTGQEEQGQLK